MGKRLPHTPDSQIRNTLRQLWLRSRERAATVKREKNTCQRCHRKGSVAKGREVKTCVHHTHHIKWEKMITFIRKELLQDPSRLELLCVECHEKEHEDD